MSWIRTHAFLSILIMSGHVHANADHEPTVFSSGVQRVALIELFTSEGCSSCPPADRWLTRLKEDPGLWTSFVPVAFHVDYWDYIGWQDRFARAEYGTRQRRYAVEGGTTIVYTPGVFHQGREWRGWRAGESLTTDEKRVGELNVRIDRGSAEIRFNSLGPGVEQLTAHVALLGMNLETVVRAGENRGRRLGHDFVALDMISTSLEKATSGYAANLTLPEIPTGVSDLAVAVWVSDASAQRPLQSVGGFLPGF